jgi:hypothetical protein
MAQAREDYAYAMGAEISNNRETVASYLRGASTNRAPESPPVRFGSLTNSEIEKMWDDLPAPRR